MYKIAIVALKGCKVCETVASVFTEEKIAYNKIYADDNDSMCDDLERLLDTVSYPIVHLTIPSRSYYLYLPNTYDKLGWRELDSTTTAVGFKGASEYINTIKQIINKL